MRQKYLLSFLFWLVILQSIVAQLSTKHYIPPITIGDVLGNQYIYISTPKNQDIPFTITPVGGTAVTGVVSNGSPFRYDIIDDPGNVPTNGNNSQLSQPLTSVGTINSNKGFIIDAQDVIYVSVRFRQFGQNNLPPGDFNQGGFHAGAIVSKGLSALGTEFRVGGFVREGNPTTAGNHLTFVSVMATENNTAVSFDDIPVGSLILNYFGTFPINQNLNEGDSFIVAIQSIPGSAAGSGSDPNNLIGSLVSSDKPVVVNSGSISGTFADPAFFNGRDYGVDQIVDASKIGSEYIFVRGDGGTSPIGDEWENVLIIAHQDNTNIFINGSNTSASTINAGEYYVIEGDQYNANENLYVQTSNPVFAYQGVGGSAGSAPNQGMFFVPPLSCENRGDVNNIASIENVGDQVFNGGVTIVTNQGANISIFENGVPRAINGSEGPFSVTGNTGYVTYKLQGLTGNITVESDDELYCAYFNRNGPAASGSFYSGFPSPPEINFNTTVASLGGCIPNVTLQSVNTDLFDSFEWFYDNGFGFVSTGNTTASITPNQAGSYKLIGTISCSGATFESQVIPVSLCPDDLDNDLIIDNVDADLDNDGISNCDESRGNVLVDYTDLNNPVLNFNNGDTDANFVTPTTNNPDNHTILGDNDGNITTTVSAALATEISYTTQFSSPANIQFIQNPNQTHTAVDGEVFSLIVEPSTKNITLLDPDNILLVDTDFDGVFEAGVDNFSASEIRFRYNPTPNGATPYRFVASEVDGITIRHSLSNLTENSTFSGNLSLTCFTLDSDGDNIPDSLDADSDNDGIPDLIEASGLNIILTGNDANLDGLDDVFTNGFVTPIDSDNDSIPDYLDLDSDNDGVYDLFEAGHAQVDANLDGRIDNAAATVGANGLVNALETVPDNFTLTYTVSDIDANNIFNYIDLDSDGDTCPDVIEAGFTDPDNDTIIGTSPVQVDLLGRVINIPDGYTVPNTEYSTGAPIILNTPFEDVAFCEASTSIISIDSTADTFQWEVSTDGGTNWSNITDDATYNGATTNNLQITNVPLAFNDYQYRVFMRRAGNSCDDTSNAITLTVEPLPTINNLVELRQCDDDNDGFISFNLNEVASDISTNFTNETFIFYETLADAQDGTTGIITNSTTFVNRTVTTDTVWARAISNFGCYRISEVTLIVSATAITSPGSGLDRVFNTCDDFLPEDGINGPNNDRDGVAAFNFSSVTAEVINSFIPSQRPELVVTYYRTEADALAEQNVISDPSNYRNIRFPNSQTIYVRVDNRLNNDCVGLAPLITLNVDPIPEANQADDLRLCDNGDDGVFDNGIVQTFDLESQTSTILGTQNPANYTVTYHTSAADANSGNNAITSTSSYENITRDLQTIYVRVTNNTTGCFTDHTSFDLIVDPLPVANPAGPVEVCDDDLDGSAQNGISQSIPIRAMTEADILGTQDPTQFSVSYHATRQNALDGTFPLNDVISNQDLTNNIVYVRVFNAATQCANGISQFDVIVHPEPSLPVSITNYEDCDNDSNGTFRDGIISSIDLESKIPEILPGLDATQFRVTFHETAQGAIDNDTSIPSNQLYQNTTPYRQTVYVRVENIATGCTNDDRLRFDIVINDPPTFELETPRIICIGETIILEPINQGPDIYDYEWFLPDGSSSIGSLLEVSSGGEYRLVARATNGNQGVNGGPCSFEQTVTVVESQIANITENDITIVDDSDNNSITIDASNLGVGDYQYALRDEQGNTTPFQDATVFENLSGGFYTLIVDDKNGCGSIELDLAILEFPKFFTPNNDGINDLWGIKGANSTFYPTSQIAIFNRFGKIVAKIDIDGPGWDGTFNGNTLPSDDYWYSIELTDRNGNIRTRKGNFSLLRR